MYSYVAQMPELPGNRGTDAIVENIQQHLMYPKVSAAEQHTGMVFASFIVTDKGEVQAVKIIKGLAPAYDEAVLAAIRQLPRMEPGQLSDGRPANVSITVPIKFVTDPAKK